MTRVSALLAIYGILLLILGDLLQNSYIGWSSLCLVAADLLIALSVCRLIVDRLRRML